METSLAKSSIEEEFTELKISPTMCKFILFLREVGRKIFHGTVACFISFRVVDGKIVKTNVFWPPGKKRYGAPPLMPTPDDIISDEFTMHILTLTAGPEWAEEELTLPPFLTEDEFGHYVSPDERETIEKRRPDLARYDLSRLSDEAKRLYDLPKRAWSAIIYARENRVSFEEKDRLVHAFNTECNLAFKPISDFARSCINNSLEDRLDFAKGHWRWRCRLDDLLETELLDGFSEYYYELVQLELDWIELYKLGRTMATIEAAHSDSRVFVSDFISLTVERERDELAPEKPTGIVQKNKAGFMSAREIGEKYNVPCEALRKQLERFRAKNLLTDDIYVETQDRGKSKPKFLYNVEKVTPIVEKLKRTKTSIKCPSKKA